MNARRRTAAGFTFVELLIVMTLAGLLLTAAVPRTGKVTEATHVDSGAAGLRSIWRAQRMHWLEHGEYAALLRTLELQGLLDGDLRTQGEPFAYAVAAADGETFSVTAARTGSVTWTGTLTIDQAGEVTGRVTDGEGHEISPSE